MGSPKEEIETGGKLAAARQDGHCPVQASATGNGAAAAMPKASPPDGWLSRCPLHPYLLCYFAVASFLAPNLALVSPRQGLPLLAGVLLVCLLVHLTLYVALGRRAMAASLAASALTLVFFYESCVRQLFLLLPGGSWRLPMGPLSMGLAKFLALCFCAILPILAGCLGWRLVDAARRRTTLCLNLLAFGLGVSSTAAVALGWHQVQASAAKPPAFVPQDAKGIGADAYPDIVHVVLDAYARDDVYRELTGEGRAPLSDLLDGWQFQVVHHSSANYPFTHGSMFCLMNFAYPQGEILFTGQAFTDCAAFRQLRHLGYRIELDSWVGMASPRAESIFAAEFSDRFWERSLWGTLRKAVSVAVGKDIAHRGEFFRRQFEGGMDRIAALETGRDQPVYLQVHVIGAHSPFVFTAEGQPLFVADFGPEVPAAAEHGSARDALPFSQFGPYYAGQAAYVRLRLEQALGSLLAQARKRPLLVIVQSDHGPGLFLFANYPDKTRQPEGFANYLAVRASPPLAVRLPDTTTPVNLFPLLFNQVFGTSLPLREDRHFLPQERGQSQDCTDRVHRVLVEGSAD